MNSFELSRSWFNFCFDNPERINPNHSAIYFFAVEHCNRLGWKEKFGFPSQMVMEAVGIKNWRTYSKALSELVEFGFIEMVEKSKNQYSSNIISIKSAYVKNTKAQSKALDKALQKHSQKQGQSIVSIDKQETKNKKQIPALSDFLAYALEKKPNVDVEAVKLKYEAWKENNWVNGNGKEIKNWKSNLLNVLQYLAEKQKPKSKNTSSGLWQ